MRITRDILLKIAHDTVTQRTRSDRDILAIYLHGSMLEDEPLLGGTADVDLFIVHNEDTHLKREIVRVSDDVHLDIAHHSRRDYRQTRELRLHPWLGPTLHGSKMLYDPQHFLDFTVASVSGQFNRPDNVIARARLQAEEARQIWIAFTLESKLPGVAEIQRYLKAVELAAGAIASLTGPLLTERRFLLRFPERAKAVGHPGLHAGLLGLIGGPTVDAGVLRSWLTPWHSTLVAIPQDQLSPCFMSPRLLYYQKAFEAILGTEQFQAVLWPLWRTWTQAAALLPMDAPPLATWQQAGNQLGLLGEIFTEKISALDAYLDMVEDVLDEWALQNGA